MPNIFEPKWFLTTLLVSFWPNSQCQLTVLKKYLTNAAAGLLRQRSRPLTYFLICWQDADEILIFLNKCIACKYLVLIYEWTASGNDDKKHAGPEQTDFAQWAVHTMLQ